MQYGAIEASCPWHRKNDKTGCKKLFKLNDPSAEARSASILLAKYWCSLARSAERQWEHVFNVDLSACPDEESVELLRIDDRPPPGSVVADDTYYAAQDDESDEGRGRGRGRRGGRGSRGRHGRGTCQLIVLDEASIYCFNFWIYQTLNIYSDIACIEM